MNTLLHRITQLEPSFAPAHVLCGAFNSLYHDDYSDGAWDLIAKAFALRSSEALDGPALQTAIVEARHGRDLVMDQLLQQYRDSRAEAGLNGVFVDGARVEGTTDEVRCVNRTWFTPPKLTPAHPKRRTPGRITFFCRLRSSGPSISRVMTSK